MNTKPDKWYAVSVSVPRDLTEAVEFAFNGMDTLGTEVDLLSNKDSDLCAVTAYFSSPPDEALTRNEFLSAARVYGVSFDDVLELKHEVIESQDWLAEWKKHWRPVEIGRFVIAAPWHDIEDSGKTIIRIEPNMAFGTGTHETTRLCLDAISGLYRPDQTFLDIGTGTGILAIAAAKAANVGTRIAAVDTDPDAVAIARVNADQNGVREHIEFDTGSIGEIEGRFDFVCANLTADVIVGLLPAILNATNEIFVLSGILSEQETSVTQRLPAEMRYEISNDGEWIAIVVRID